MTPKKMSWATGCCSPELSFDLSDQDNYVLEPPELQLTCYSAKWWWSDGADFDEAWRLIPEILPKEAVLHLCLQSADGTPLRDLYRTRAKQREKEKTNF